MIHNPTECSAKFEFVPQSQVSRSSVVVEIDRPTGIVAGNSDTPIVVSFAAQRIGSIEVTCYFKVLGSDDPPLPFVLSAVATGPSISLSATSINFGSVPVLNAQSRILTVSNQSLIQAQFQGVVEASTQSFGIFPESGVIEPESDFQIEVKCLLTDILTYKAVVKLSIDFVATLSVHLKATGTGSPIVSSIDMSEVDFGYIFTEQTVVKAFTMHNVSGRSYELKFSAGKVQTAKDAVNDFVFPVTPNGAVIAKQEQCDFKLSLYSSGALSFSVRLTVTGTAGRERVDLYWTLLKGCFVPPLLARVLLLPGRDPPDTFA
jgi:hypothetical protein